MKWVAIFVCCVARRLSNGSSESAVSASKSSFFHSKTRAHDA